MHAPPCQLVGRASGLWAMSPRDLGGSCFVLSVREGASGLGAPGADRGQLCGESRLVQSLWRCAASRGFRSWLLRAAWRARRLLPVVKAAVPAGPHPHTVVVFFWLALRLGRTS